MGMDGLNRFIKAISGILGIGRGEVLSVAALLLLVLLLFFRRDFWGTFKFVLIVGALGMLAYFGYNLTLVGMEKRDKLVNKPFEMQDTNR